MDDKEAYEKLKAEQDRLEPVMPIRYMAGVLKTGNGYVQELLKRLVATGKAKAVHYPDEASEMKRYRIL